MAEETVAIDLFFRDRPRMIAAGLLTGDAPLVVDPGPPSTLEALREGLDRNGVRVGDLDAVLLTHIHLDHAAATGALVRENPGLPVFVHTEGARHLLDPTRLVESARRIYGDAMDRLFGDVLAVPRDNVRVLAGGERLVFGGHRLYVAYTPGHARHHVSFLDENTGTAFVGDTAGLRDDGVPCVLPPTPPPDVDLELWLQSLDEIDGWHAERLFLTHFGSVAPVDEHLSQLRVRLDDWAARVRASLALPGDDDSRAERFARRITEQLEEELGDRAEWYTEGADLASSWHGLARYWRKQLREESSPPR